MFLSCGFNYSLGIALPERYGHFVVDGRRHVSEASMRLPDDRLAGQYLHPFNGLPG